MQWPDGFAVFGDEDAEGVIAMAAGKVTEDVGVVCWRDEDFISGTTVGRFRGVHFFQNVFNNRKKNYYNYTAKYFYKKK